MTTPLGSGSLGFLAFITTALSLASMVFWMVVGWRAMRAHEDIADVLRGRSQE